LSAQADRVLDDYHQGWKKLCQAAAVDGAAFPSLLEGATKAAKVLQDLSKLDGGSCASETVKGLPGIGYEYSSDEDSPVEYEAEHSDFRYVAAKGKGTDLDRLFFETYFRTSAKRSSWILRGDQCSGGAYSCLDFNDAVSVLKAALKIEVPSSPALYRKLSEAYRTRLMSDLSHESIVVKIDENSKPLVPPQIFACSPPEEVLASYEKLSALLQGDAESKRLKADFARVIQAIQEKRVIVKGARVLRECMCGS
jgi:hypothetical protein